MDTEPRGTASLDSEPVGAELTGIECKMESWAQAAASCSFLQLPAASCPFHTQVSQGISRVDLSSPGDEEKGEDQQGRVNTLLTGKKSGCHTVHYMLL